MDHNTSTREEFTTASLSVELPSSADQQWTDLALKLRNLFEKLAYHPAMAPNLHQTYMTPAASKNKVYFMWDFVGRTLYMVHKVDPTLENLSKSDGKQWTEAVERATFSGMLITDQMKGALDQMTEQTYPGQAGQHPEFGQEILDIAETLC